MSIDAAQEDRFMAKDADRPAKAEAAPITTYTARVRDQRVLLDASG